MDTLSALQGTVPDGIVQLLRWLAWPELGLPLVFLVSFLSATLLPMGSEPVVFGLIKLQPQLFWVIIAVATLGNTLGGAVSWWMGWGAHKAWASRRHQAVHRPVKRWGVWQRRARIWLRRLGPKACLLSWLPVVGDPICVVAGWMRLPFWPCVMYMAIGKLGRYITVTGALLWGVSALS